MAKPDKDDQYSRPAPEAWKRWAGKPFTFGVPSAPDFMGNHEYERLFGEAVKTMTDLGGTKVEVDYAPFEQAAGLLYGGPWVAERYAAIGPFMETAGDTVDPTVREIVTGGKRFSAVELFQGEYQRQALKDTIDDVFAAIDVLLLPTAPTHYTLAEIAGAPIANNTNLGKYTNFMNLMDLAAIAIPAGMTTKGHAVRRHPWPPPPFGTCCSPTWAGHFPGSRRTRQTKAPPHGETVPLAVVGAHLSGLPLNHQLTDRGATLIKACRDGSLLQAVQPSGDSA